jgi:uncharacterized repeat protein (TIGR02543 family)
MEQIVGEKTVTFDKNNADAGSTEASPRTLHIKPSVKTVGTLPAVPQRPGYAFAGWNTKAGGGGTAFTAATQIKANITVYAQ